MSVIRPSTSAWAGDGAIGLTTGETLAGIWVSTWGMWSGGHMTDPDPPTQAATFIRSSQEICLRLGLVWTDNPTSAQDPHSTLSDTLWVTAAQWQFRTATGVFPHPLAAESTQSRVFGLASHATPPVKVEGQRRAEGAMWIKFCGSESMPGGSPNPSWHNHMGMHASVSALVMLPPE